jgi:pimeloyl-ACP methyl ester carboxylesterase
MAHFHTADGTLHMIRRDGAGVPILFLHGLACTARMWVHQIRHFGARHTVIAPDFLGHGGSPSPADPACYSEARFAAHAVAALDEAGVERAVVVGLSMGGTVGAVLALEHPTRVAGLMMADSGSGSEDPEGARALLRGVVRMLRAEGLEAYAQAILQSPGMGPYGRQGARQRRHLLALLRHNDAEGLARTIEGVQIARPTMYERPLARITVPTTVLVGEDDRDCIRPSRYAADTIPDAVYVEVSGAAHLTALEAPAAFDAALEQLLARIAG